MEQFNKHLKKIFSLTICFLLLLTIVYPSLNSQEYDNENILKNYLKAKTKGFFYDFLTRLIEIFPFLENSTLIQRLLEIFADPCMPEIELIKSSNVQLAKIDDEVIYSYKVINKGNLELTDITLTDNKLGSIELNNTALSPGKWAYGEKSYIVNEGDLPGPIVNNAVVNASYDDGQKAGAVEDSDKVSITIDVEEPAIEIEKEADKESATIGEEITYSYVVKNIGEIYLYDIELEDDKIGTITLNNTILAPGQWAAGEISYTVTIEDCGTTISNTAVANGSYCSPYGDGYVTDEDTASVVINCPKPDIEVIKQSDKDTATIGDTITYSYTVTNIGDIPLSQVFVEDDILGSVSLNNTYLEPGQWATGELCYIVTEDDCGTIIVNNATANGSYCDLIGSGYVEDEDSVSVSVICGEPNITLHKKASKNIVSVGDMITYYYLVYNTGSVDLFDITVVDDPLGEVELNNTELSPGEWAIGEKTYTVKESDYPYPIENKAVAEGYTINQEKVTDDAIMIIPFEIDCQEDVFVDDDWQGQSDVDEYNSDLYWEINAFNNFEDAIDIVCECGTVHVLPGTYAGQILIDKSLNLIAEGDVNLIGSNLQGYTIDGSSKVVKPIIFAYGGELDDNNVVTTKKISVKVDGFHIDGNSNTISVLYHNVESGCTQALITNNIIEESGVGIQIQGCSNDTTITWNEIKYAQNTIGKIGILIESINDCEPDNVEIHHNKIGIECGNNIGIWNKVSNIVNAEYNWWGADDGPQSPDSYDNYDAITGRIADGFGDEVRGLVHFDPWAGVESNATITEVYFPENDPHWFLEFDARDSFGYSLDGTPLGLEYWWDFGYKNTHSIFIHFIKRYEEPGTYDVSLKVSAIDQDLDPTSKLTDTSYYTVTQRPG